MYGGIGSIIFPPNRGSAVIEHCGMYTVGYGAGRDSCPGQLPGLVEIASASRCPM